MGGRSLDLQRLPCPSDSRSVRFLAQKREEEEVRVQRERESAEIDSVIRRIQELAREVKKRKRKKK